LTSDLASVFVLSLLAMANPSLLAATTLMMFLPNPKRLMLGYLLGAYTTSITLGLAIAFSLHGSSFQSTSKRTLSPAEDIALGVIALAIAVVLATGRDAPVRAHRQRRREANERAGKTKEPWHQRMLGRGSARVTFVVGAALSFPGVTYLDALDHIVKLNPGTVATVLLIVYFCLMQQILLEVPLLGYLFAPEWTQGAVTRFRAWLGRRGRRVAVIGASAVGALLIARGLITLLG
jgi:Sap, sulfolipid-1-addressing protein